MKGQIRQMIFFSIKIFIFTIVFRNNYVYCMIFFIELRYL